MSDHERVNSVLESLGSPYRTFSGDNVNNSLVAVIEAIPGYIQRSMDEREEAQKNAVVEAMRSIAILTIGESKHNFITKPNQIVKRDI